MELEQLNHQISRLKTVFGEKNFSEERLVLIRKALIGLTIEQVLNVIDSFISSHKAAPLPKDFQDAANIQRRQVPQKALKPSPQGFCSNDPKKLLAEQFPNCKSLNEALEKEKAKIRNENT